jgi:hypothetical protein
MLEGLRVEGLVAGAWTLTVFYFAIHSASGGGKVCGGQIGYDGLGQAITSG